MTKATERGFTVQGRLFCRSRVFVTGSKEVVRSGLDLRIPPVLGIVLSRCARRDAIPTSRISHVVSFGQATASAAKRFRSNGVGGSVATRSVNDNVLYHSLHIRSYS